jgi:hypothetical protein
MFKQRQEDGAEAALFGLLIRPSGGNPTTTATAPIAAALGSPGIIRGATGKQQTQVNKSLKIWILSICFSFMHLFGQ